MAEINTKALPNNKTAEESVLGCSLYSKDALFKTMEHLTSESFFFQEHRYIFSSMIELYNENIPVDTISVSEKLKQKDWLEKIGGSYYLTGLSESVPISSNIQLYIDVVKEKYKLRKLINLSSKVMNNAYNDGNSEDITNDLITDVFDSTKISTEELITSENLVKQRGIGLKRMLQGFSIGTGYPSIDRHLAYGFAPQQLSIITARPSLGKSAFKSNISIHQAGNGVKILQITPEQGFDREMNRFASIECQIPLQELVHMRDWVEEDDKGILVAKTEEGQKKLEEIRNHAKRMEFSGMSFDGSGGITLGRIRRIISDIKNRQGLDVVYIDLIDRVAEVFNATTGNKPAIMAQALNILSNTAKDFDVHICVLAQLGRKVEQRSDKHPMLSDLKDAGALEEYADLVLAIYREGYYNEEEYDDNMEIMILKQRDGPKRNIDMKWYSSTITIDDLNPDEEIENQGYQP